MRLAIIQIAPIPMSRILKVMKVYRAVHNEHFCSNFLVALQNQLILLLLLLYIYDKLNYLHSVAILFSFFLHILFKGINFVDQFDLFVSK